ncbi:putative zinc-binding protein [Neomoorella mulderi]|uniref:DGC domain protein n=1 Tax=Moorella mulderi DSM 14980 TaxID=1122241 RepID=A0A151B199_9FIRM|nr:putative zinc-binding protein [Moorella mulderi]KYH33427.1 DGC domain protein [Moorella mulderi DSM 14980]
MAKCTCEPAEIMLFPCAGGSNVGQLANQAAVKLDQEGAGKLFCLAGLGGHVQSIVESTKVARRIVAIDGCPIGCAKATVEHAGFLVTDYVMVTRLGIQKNHEFAWTGEELDRVVQAVKESLES